jgi:hypothetical protein
MLKKLRISFWIYGLSIIIFIVFFVGILSKIFHYTYPVLLMVAYAGLYFSPLAILLLLIDIIFNKECEKKYFLVALVINVIVICFMVYVFQNLFSNFPPLS